jgi:hypothetical protein
VGTHVPNRLSSMVLARAHELNLKMWVPTFLKKLMNLTDVRTFVPTFLTKPTNIYQFLVSSQKRFNRFCTDWFPDSVPYFSLVIGAI